MDYQNKGYKLVVIITFITLIMILTCNFFIVLVDDNKVKLIFYIVNLLLTIICSSMLNQKIFVFSSRKSKLYYIFSVLNFFFSTYAFDKNHNKPVLVSSLFLVQSIGIILFIIYNLRDQEMIINEKELDKNRNNPIAFILLVSWVVITLVQKWHMGIAFTLVAGNLVLITLICIRKIMWNKKQVIGFMLYLLIPVIANSVLIFTYKEIYRFLGIALLTMCLWSGSYCFTYKSKKEVSSELTTSK